MGILFLIASCLTVAQSSRHTTHAADLGSFAGTWRGEYKGQMFAILNLHVENGRLTGTLSTAHTISLDANGDVKTVEGEATKDKDTPVLEATLVGNSLIFKNRAADDEMVTYKLQLSGENEAGLRPDGAPETMKVNPFTLTRGAPNAK